MKCWVKCVSQNFLQQRHGILNNDQIFPGALMNLVTKGRQQELADGHRLSYGGLDPY